MPFVCSSLHVICRHLSEWRKPPHEQHWTTKIFLSNKTHVHDGIWEGVRSWSSLSPERHHFSSARKKKLWCIKSIPNIVECVEQAFYKQIHPITCLRWSGAVLTFCSPKKLLFLQKSLFLDGAQTQIYNLFMKKLRHRLSALPQPYCRLLGSPLSSLRAAYQPCSSPAAGFCSQPPTWCHFRQGVSQKCWGS